MICNSRCVKPRPHSSLQHCGVCHQTFSGTTAGDMHRVPLKSKIIHDGKLVRDGYRNRCLSEREMLAIGMVFDPDRRIWRCPRGAEEPPHW